MIVNQSYWERRVRTAVGALLVIAGTAGLIADPALALGLTLVGLVLLLTGVLAYCPVWHLLGLSTQQSPRADPRETRPPRP